MSNEFRFNMNFILISGITAFHLTLAKLRTAFALLGNVFFYMIWFTPELHASASVAWLPSLFLSALPAETLRSWFLQSSFGWWFGTVFAVLLMRQFLYLSSQLCYLFCQCSYLGILCGVRFIQNADLFNQHLHQFCLIHSEHLHPLHCL